MISSIPSKRNFNTLQYLLDEQKSMFDEYVARVHKALEVNSEVIEYVREKCEDRYENILAEMDRDNKIFYSRLRHLQKKLEACILYFESTSKQCFSGVKQPGMKKLHKHHMYEYCLKNFFRFYDSKRDIQNQLKQAQRRWLKMQDQILSCEN